MNKVPKLIWHARISLNYAKLQLTLHICLLQLNPMDSYFALPFFSGGFPALVILYCLAVTKATGGQCALQISHKVFILECCGRQKQKPRSM